MTVSEAPADHPRPECARPGCSNRAVRLRLPDLQVPGEPYLLCGRDLDDLIRSCRGRWRGSGQGQAEKWAARRSLQQGREEVARRCRLCRGFHVGSESGEHARLRHQSAEVVRTVLDDAQLRALVEAWHPSAAPAGVQSSRAQRRRNVRESGRICGCCRRRPVRQSGGPLCEACRVPVELSCKGRVRYPSRKVARRAAEAGDAVYPCVVCEQFHVGPPVDFEDAELASRAAAVLRGALTERQFAEMLKAWEPAG